MTSTLLWFMALGFVLVVAGTVLTRAADEIAEHTGMGRVLAGALLLATATSLPELATDISAVRLGEPDLAAGDLFGSSIANMAILALLTLMTPARALLRNVPSAHLLTGWLAIGLTLGAGALVFAGSSYAVMGVSPGSAVLVLAFVVGMRAIYRRRAPVAGGPTAATVRSSRRALGIAVGRFIAATALILLVAHDFAETAARLAHLSGLGSAFVGTVLLGASTSVPELVSGIAAVRMGAYDLAIANVFGSNSFNMIVFLALDLAHPGGSVFGALSAVHAFTAVGASLLMAMALYFMSRRR